MALTGLALCGLAACATQTSFQEPVQPEVLKSQLRFEAAYVLLPGDQLEVAVFRVPDASKTVIVRPDGYITLPGLKDVQVSGLTVPEATKKITALMAERLISPDVTVTVLNPRDANVYVMGEVARPGPVPYRSAITAAQAVAQSGGVVRSASFGGVAVIRLDKSGYLNATVIPVQNGGAAGFYAALALVLLQPNDIIVAPESTRSQFTRFIQDYLNGPLSGINQILNPYFQLRVLQDVAKQNG
jgi:polysaccharide export outer membrane protein